MAVIGDAFRADILDEMRKRAAQGASIAELAHYVQDELGCPRAMTVPAIAYICHAFTLPLLLIHELHQAFDEGPYARALEAVVWFSAEVHKSFSGADGWNWRDMAPRLRSSGFNAEKMVVGASLANGRVEVWEPGEASALRYVRGWIELNVDKLEINDSGQSKRREGIIRFVAAFANALRPDSEVHEESMGCEYQVEDKGPVVGVRCVIHAVAEQKAVVGQDQALAGV